MPKAPKRIALDPVRADASRSQAGRRCPSSASSWPAVSAPSRPRHSSSPRTRRCTAARGEGRMELDDQGTDTEAVSIAIETWTGFAVPDLVTMYEEIPSPSCVFPSPGRYIVDAPLRGRDRRSARARRVSRSEFAMNQPETNGVPRNPLQPIVLWDGSLLYRDERG